MKKVAIVRVIKDVYRADYAGNGAYDYCMEHGLFHLAFHKGELLVMSVEKHERFWASVGRGFSDAFECKFRASTDAATVDGLRNWAKRHNLKEDVSLADAIEKRSHFGCDTPTTDELELVRIIDGDIPLKDFRLVEYGIK